eukprot:Protomagalhaensia_wolfi_Nauph_80__782@NODE_1450_length_1524_cov_636_907744_g1121_i0_p1_GENE_NODE_1450_length_1524_cov_636_907744_g1121_i0NODE_1450_length_1524_cov_636_907744_g1121_i0_p1_ORF_typecomplete_len264_score30_44Methyltransf_23/PF13489_6/2_1e12Methyltransf_25/PF13649_6/3_1e10Methyltransf_11/PF08241_12/7_8e10Pox_MCEL/PF03291_16/3e09Methyltransf_31/PF13847_6/9e09Methyltransf_12/PF08242_12/1e07Ubie_methyltran/PF01209_18/5_1e06MTS/PF05175_14/1_7e05NodS/PF05401_11/0_0001CMAS/PF02353_20/0_0008
MMQQNTPNPPNPTSSEQTTLKDTAPGAAIYSKPLLEYLYDLSVHSFTNPFLWKCPTNSYLVPWFNRLSSFSTGPRRHLDIGVGTGYFLGKAPLTNVTELVLLDLNPNCLAAAAKRVHEAHPDLSCQTVQADFLSLDPLPLTGKFDSISAMLLLHCLPGPPSRKAAAVARLSSWLADDGVLYGMTVLGKDVPHHILGRLWLWGLNARGVFDNYADDASALTEPLKAAFQEVRTEVVGTALLFEARKPIRQH